MYQLQQHSEVQNDIGLLLNGLQMLIELVCLNQIVLLQVSVDLFVLTRSQSVDLASIAPLCGTTAGQLYHYCPFVSPADDDQLYNDLRWNVQRPQVTKQSVCDRCQTAS